jgi:hypothetical protein
MCEGLSQTIEPLVAQGPPKIDTMYAAAESKAERVAANGRPLGRGNVSREHRFSLSTRVGCSRT